MFDKRLNNRRKSLTPAFSREGVVKGKNCDTKTAYQNLADILFCLKKKKTKVTTFQIAEYGFCLTEFLKPREYHMGKIYSCSQGAVVGDKIPEAKFTR